MKTITLSNEQNTLRIVCKTDTFYGNFTVMNVEGVTDDAIKIGLDIQEIEYEPKTFYDFAEDNNLKLSITDNSNVTPTTLVAIATALAISTSSPLSPQAYINSAYTKTLAATGGNGPYTWALAEGDDLPDGLSLSTDGIISGTPTDSADTYSFDIVATDYFGQTKTKSFSLVLNAATTTTSTTTSSSTTTTTTP